ncbi:hypothetical protein OKW30_006021 [Paraburkholderia sp. Clong3]
MGLLLEDEADCLNHQHKRRRHWPPIRRQRRAAAPYRASGLVPSAISAVHTLSEAVFSKWPLSSSASERSGPQLQQFEPSVLE